MKCRQADIFCFRNISNQLGTVTKQNRKSQTNKLSITGNNSTLSPITAGTFDKNLIT